jgi:hypothetical protein
MRLIFKQYNKKRDVNKEINLLMSGGSWWYISYLQKLSESFIEKYKDKVDWSRVSLYQKLSEDFIEKYEDKVDWYCIFKYQKLSPEFKEKWKHKNAFNI